MGAKPAFLDTVEGFQRPFARSCKREPRKERCCEKSSEAGPEAGCRPLLGQLPNQPAPRLPNRRPEPLDLLLQEPGSGSKGTAGAHPGHRRFPSALRLQTCSHHAPARGLVVRAGANGVIHKRVYRLYKQEGLELRLKTRNKRVALPRVPCPPAAAPNERWSLALLDCLDRVGACSPDGISGRSASSYHVTVHSLVQDGELILD